MRNLISVCGCHGTWALQLPNPNLAFSKLTRLKEYRTHRSGGHSEGIHSFIFNIRWWIVRAAYRSFLLCYCGGGGSNSTQSLDDKHKPGDESFPSGGLSFFQCLSSPLSFTLSLFLSDSFFFFSLFDKCVIKVPFNLL